MASHKASPLSRFPKLPHVLVVLVHLLLLLSRSQQTLSWILILEEGMLQTLASSKSRLVVQSEHLLDQVQHLKLVFELKSQLSQVVDDGGTAGEIRLQLGVVFALLSQLVLPSAVVGSAHQLKYPLHQLSFVLLLLEEGPFEQQLSCKAAN